MRREEKESRRGRKIDRPERVKPAFWLLHELSTMLASGKEKADTLSEYEFSALLQPEFSIKVGGGGSTVRGGLWSSGGGGSKSGITARVNSLW